MLRWTSIGVMLVACSGGTRDEDGGTEPQPSASATVSPGMGLTPIPTESTAAAPPVSPPSSSGTDGSSGSVAVPPIPSDATPAPPSSGTPVNEPAPSSDVPSEDTTGATEAPDATDNASTADGTSTSATDESSALAELVDYLDVEHEQRAPIDEQDFAHVALTRDQAAQAAELLWQDRATLIRETRRTEHEARAITVDGKTMRYDFTTFGDAPVDGRSLYISLHGGGNAEPSVNDQQWENQKGLYQPDEGIYLSPRAPTDTWNLWHEPPIDPMFARLISNLVVLEDVNPDRVYVMGYSAGGDGVYQLGPRMADYWAAAAAMAGHPNEAQPLSLRNIGFTVHVGALDTGYDRNLVAQEWSDWLAELQASDPDGYSHVVQIHEGKPHWMDLEDAVAVPWMAEFTRDTTPEHIVWFQDDITHPTFYWLAVEAAQAGTLVTARVDGQHLDVSSEDVRDVSVRLNDELLDLDNPVTFSFNGVELHSGPVTRSIAVLARTLDEREDPRLMFSAELRSN